MEKLSIAFCTICNRSNDSDYRLFILLLLLYHEFRWLKTDASLQAALWYCTIESSTLSGCCQQKRYINMRESWGTFKGKKFFLVVPVKSWSMNCPHCINIWVTEARGISLSSWIESVTSRASGSLLPFLDLLTLWTPSWYSGGRYLNIMIDIFNII